MSAGGGDPPEDLLDAARRAKGRGALPLAQAHLEARLAEAPGDLAARLELGVVVKLRGDIPRAFRELRAVLEGTPPASVAVRQQARFVLGLTHGDVRELADAVRCFEEAAALAPETPLASAARHYAASYREHHGLDGGRQEETP